MNTHSDTNPIFAFITDSLKSVILAFALSITFTASAAEFPSRPIRIVVPSTPSGGLDVLARILAPKLTEKWGQPVVVENRPGAGGVIGNDVVAKAPPDGHTLLMVAAGFAAQPFLYKLPYEMPGDLAPVTIIGDAPNVLVVHPSLPVRSAKELIALAKRKPGELAYASSGVGTSGHLGMALLERTAGIKLVHVPYKGSGAATAAVVSGETQMLFTATAAVLPHVKSGRLRALAVTSAKRWPTMPDVPSLAEAAAPGFEVAGWYAMLAPGRIPKPILNRIYTDLMEVLKQPDTHARIENAGYLVNGITPDAFAKLIDRDMKKWSTVIREAGIKATDTE